MYFVIGSEGFLGQAISSSLKAQGNQVRTCDIAGSPDFKIDVINNFIELQKIFQKDPPTYVINLAAFSNGHSCNQNPSKVYELNVKFVKSLAYACNSSKVKCLFHASSEWIYGKGPVYQNDPSDATLFYHRDHDLYSKSKLDSELQLQDYVEARKGSLFTKIAIYRFGIIYGNANYFSNCIVDKLLSAWNENIQMTMNAPTASRSFVSLDDIIDLFINSPFVSNALLGDSDLKVFNIQGPSSYPLFGISDYINGKKTSLHSYRPDEITNTTEDRKFVKSDLPMLLDRPPRDLESYLSSYLISHPKEVK